MSKELDPAKLDRINKYLNMLNSNNADKRYEACEELRVSSWLPDYALAALGAATNDSDHYVAEAAKDALKAHEPDVLPEIKYVRNTNYEALDERNRAKAPYTWLRWSPLLTVFTFLTIFIISYLKTYSYFDFYTTTFIAILVSAGWHILLLLSVGNPDDEFAAWHGRQALLLAGIRTGTCLIFLAIDSISGSSISFFWVIPILIIMWIVMPIWGTGQAARGECTLANWVGHPVSPSNKLPIKNKVEKVITNEVNNMSGSQEQVLTKILGGLKSEDAPQQLEAINELKTLDFSSPAIRLRLEILAVKGLTKPVRTAAYDALELNIHRFIQSQTNRLDSLKRSAIIREIQTWSEQGLLDPDRAKVLAHRYNFDMEPVKPVAPAPEVIKPPVPQLVAEQAVPKPAPVIPATPARVAAKPAKPAGPSLTLSERLLSQATINIALYLGAFLVIGAAMILAYLSEGSRMPILLSVSALFAAGSIAIKKRLPQPSFTLFVVFSFLLPINGIVIDQTYKLSGQTASAYWAAIFFVMALVWAFSTWFYSSRIFTIASFVALCLAFLKFGSIFTNSMEWYLLSLVLASLIGLLGVHLLRDWKDAKFALPLFGAAQLVNGLTLLASFLIVASMLFTFYPGINSWFATSLTWVVAAAFFAWSDFLFAFPLYPWAVVAALLPVSWLSLKSFNAPASAQVIGLWVWGTIFSLASEFSARRTPGKLTKYAWSLLLASLPLFVISALWAFFENAFDNETIAYAFGVLLGTGVVYTLLTTLRTRTYIWLTALIFGLAAYFTFFQLSLIQTANVYAGYQLLGSSLLLLVPELFFKSDFTFKEGWRWPPFVLGAILTAGNILFVLAGQSTAVEISVVMGVYALLFAAYALHLHRPWIGYFGTAFAAIATAFIVVPSVGILNVFDLSVRLAVLTGLSVIYFVGGFILRGEKTPSWGSMLRISGLALGTIVTILAFVVVNESRILTFFLDKTTRGWDVLVIAILFYAETYIRGEDRMESTGPFFAGIAGFLILRQFNVTDLPYHLLTLSLLWLGSDLLFSRTLNRRRSAALTRLIGGAIALTNLPVLVDFGYRFGHSYQAASIFGVYAVFFAISAWLYRKPVIGYASTASLAFSVLLALQFLHRDLWLPALTGLSVLYFVGGYFLRPERTRGWGGMFRISGLALGAVISIAAMILFKPGGEWYIIVTGAMFLAETYLRREDRLEISAPIFFSMAAYLGFYDFHVKELSYSLLLISLIWLSADLLYMRTFKTRRFEDVTRLLGGGVAFGNAVLLSTLSVPLTAAECFGVYTVFFAIYTWIYRKPFLGYIATAALSLSLFFELQNLKLDLWLPVLTGLSVLYFVGGYFLRPERTRGWGSMLRISGLVLGAILSTSALILFKHAGEWYILVTGAMFLAETYLRRLDYLEISAPLFFSMAAYLGFHDFKITELSYSLLVISLVWLSADILYSRMFKARPMANVIRLIGGVIALSNTVLLISPLSGAQPAAICFGVYAIFFALDAWHYHNPLIGYIAAVSLPASVFCELQALHQNNWLYAIVAIAVIYYAIGFILRRRHQAKNWMQMFLYSGLGLAVINSLSAPLHIGLDSAIPVAIAATLFAVEAFERRNVWLGFPANLLYLESYFLILAWLDVRQPQFFSIGAALLGMLMHYLLTRAGSRRGAFLTGTFSQLVLLGTTFIQLLSTQDISFFPVIFFQGLAVLVYGIVARSRSLVVAPVLFIVASVIAIIYSASKGIATVIMVGITGILLLLLGILAVILRERITKIGERFSDWQA